MNDEAIKQLEMDENFIKLLKEYEQTNLFEIIGGSWKELWHSSFICWLLNPKENHGLEDLALKELMKLYCDKLNIEIEETDWKAMIISKEKCLKNIENEISMNKHSNNRGKIDIYGENKNTILVIENKVKAKENEKQTNSYYKFFEDEAFSAKQKYFIYLNADKTDEPEDEHFVHITYQDFYENILAKCVMDERLNKEAQMIIKHYIRNLSLPLEGDKIKYSDNYRSPMAFTSVELCEKIYKNNISAFSQIKKQDAFFQKYGNLINIILESVGKNKIKPRKSQNDYTKFLENLWKSGFITPDESSSEFVAMRYGAYFIVQLTIEDEKICFMSGYIGGEKEYTGEEVVEPLKDENQNIRYFDSVSSALDNAIYEYRTKVKQENFILGNNSGVGVLLKTKYGKGQTLGELKKKYENGEIKSRSDI